MAVRKRNGKLPYEADGSLLWFHRHKDTAVAQGYEVNYWVGNDAVEHWAAVPSHIYAWGPYGDYAFNRYQSWCMGRQRAYLDQVCAGEDAGQLAFPRGACTDGARGGRFERNAA